MIDKPSEKSQKATTPPNEGTGAKQPTVSNDSPIPTGTLINNNYRILELLSVGGMGEVFRAENILTGDPVAIKVVLRSLASDQRIAALFKREAQILCGLSHQAIVSYQNFVLDSDLDRFCLIMEYIDGITLSEWIKANGALPVSATTRLIRRLAEGLDRAHRREVVHRDLSPDNVMLRGSNVDEPVLIDFGIAKSAELTEGTLHGQFAGKFKYISPEQLGHFDGVIGPQTDVYGLGLLIAAAVIGTPLNMGGSVVEAVDARRDVPDLSAVPTALRGLLAQLLQPDPAKRPARMSDVLVLLDADNAGAQDRTVIRSLDAITPTVPPSTTPPADSDSPFGSGQGRATLTHAPITRTAAPTTLHIAGRAKAPKRQGAGFGWLLALLAIGAVGAGYAWQTGLLDRNLSPTVSPIATDPMPDGQSPQMATGPDTSTRAGFLASLDTGPCSYVARVEAGPNTGLIEVFSDRDGAFAGLPAAYEEAFGARPDLLDRLITSDQCAALDFAKGLQSNGGITPLLLIGDDRVVAGDTISGRLSGTQGQPVWMVLISAQGGVHNITSLLGSPDAGARPFAFGLSLGEGEGAKPQLLLAVTSPTPLARAAAAADGSRAQDLLPLIAEEIGEKPTGITLAYVMLSPATNETDILPSLSDGEGNNGEDG